MTTSEFCEQRFLRYHAMSPGTRQEYGTWPRPASSRISAT
jgi:hypothetical protein